MSTPQAENVRLAADTRLGSYRITRCIGEGGMGTVYEGVHEGLGKRVAIKTLRTATGPQRDELIERFVREGKAVAKIQHPNVVDVFDVAVHEGSPYLVMEYLEGEDLGARMGHEAPMAPPAIADMLIPVVSALAAAHDAGIVHRDLKPDNIFVTKNKAGALEPKLVDFGISKLNDGEALHLTATNAMLGTPYYMSPEQAGSAKHVDHRSDIFSLGVIMYQCATYELPFKGDSLYQLLGAILHSEPTAPCSLVDKFPPDFELVIARAMKKDPAERFQSAAELGGALLQFASARTRMMYEPEFARFTPSAARPIANSVRARGGLGSWMLWAALFLCAIGALVFWSRPVTHGAEDAARARSSETEVRTVVAASAPAVVASPRPASEPVAPSTEAAPATPDPARALVPANTSANPPANTQPSDDTKRPSASPSHRRPNRRTLAPIAATVAEKAPNASSSTPPVAIPAAPVRKNPPAAPTPDDLLHDRK